MTITGPVQQQAWAARELPPAEHLTGGIWSLPIPIPHSPLRYVLCYALSTSLGPVLVDPGWPGEEGWQALEQGLSQAGWRIEDVRGVLVTHAHTDHQGLAERVRAASGCWVGMHAADAALLAGYADGSRVKACNDVWLDWCGAPAEDRVAGLEMNEARMREVGSLVPDRLIGDNDRVDLGGRSVTALWTPGHTPGHLCFASPDDKVLLAGDHLLPRISSHVGGYAVDDTDDLGAYLASLHRVAHLPGAAEAEVLPGHEYRFRGIRERVRAAVEHHARRLLEVCSTVTELGTATAWDVASRVTWSRGWDETRGTLRRLALAETAAHLRWLGQRGLLIESGTTCRTWTSSDAVLRDADEQVRLAMR